MSPDEPFTDFANLSRVLSWLRKEIPPEQVSQLPATKGRPALDYVNHAVVTDRLNTIAPGWTYSVTPVVVEGTDGWPHVLAVFGEMTILGVSRQEVGAVDKPSTYGQELKEAISDFIRRAGMRFGVAVQMWSKQELEPATAVVAGVRHDTAAPAVAGPQSGDTASEAPEESPAGAGNPTGKGPVPVGDHAHVWTDSPTLSKFEICAVEGCLETRRKQVAS